MDKKEFEQLCKFLKSNTVVISAKTAYLSDKVDEIIDYVKELEKQIESK